MSAYEVFLRAYRSGVPLDEAFAQGLQANRQGVAMSDEEMKSAKYLNEISQPGFLHFPNLTAINAFVQRTLSGASSSRAEVERDAAVMAEAYHNAWRQEWLAQGLPVEAVPEWRSLKEYTRKTTMRCICAALPADEAPKS